MKENKVYLVKENKFDNRLITELDSIIDSCIKDCQTQIFSKI